MKQIAAASALALLTVPAAAEESLGNTLIEEGAKMLLQGMLQELDPAIQDFTDLASEFSPELRRFAEEMGPAMRTLFTLIDDFEHYMPPEVQPNGDIIIRRRPDAPDFAPEGEIEL